MRGTKIALLVVVTAPLLWLVKFIIYDTWDAYMYSESRNIARCVVKTDQEAIDAAIDFYVRSGEATRKIISGGQCNKELVDGSCVNPFPYASVAQFKADNPECCSVTSDLPGDLHPSLRERIKSGAFPKIYPVKMRFNEHGRDLNGNSSLYVRSELTPIDCLGRTVND